MKKIKTEDNSKVQQDEKEIASLFPERKKAMIEEIESDGSGNAFEKTETVEEDNFDKLSEK